MMYYLPEINTTKKVTGEGRDTNGLSEIRMPVTRYGGRKNSSKGSTPAEGQGRAWRGDAGRGRAGPRRAQDISPTRPPPLHVTMVRIRTSKTHSSDEDGSYSNPRRPSEDLSRSGGLRGTHGRSTSGLGLSCVQTPCNNARTRPTMKTPHVQPGAHPGQAEVR